MVRRDLTKLLNPESIAIIGASRDEKKLGSIVLNNIVLSGFRGDIYPINPKARKVNKFKCYKDYSSLPVTPDLAIIAIPSKFVNDVLKAIGEKGTKNVVVLSAGYREIGKDGVKLEKELIDISKKYEINLIGPNCLGFINTLSDLNASFGQQVENVGNLRFISQSGAIASSMCDWAEGIGLGFSQFFTLGNKSVVNEVDILDYWLKTEEDIPSSKRRYLEDDKLSNLRPIGLYLESIDDGEDFLNTVSQLTVKDPVFLIKPGRSKAAQKAMQSHTGSIAGEENVLEQVLDESGVIRCYGIEDVFDYAKAFSWENTPNGPNVVILSNAGGPAVVTTDYIEDVGLKLAKIDDEVHKKLVEYLPRAANVLNPIDVLGDALSARYGYALDAVLGQTNVNAIIIILTPQVMTEIHQTAEIIARLSAVHKKPIFCSFMGGMNVKDGEKVLNMHKIPNFSYPERAVNALGKMWGWKQKSIKKAFDIKRMGGTRAGILRKENNSQIQKINQILGTPKQERREALNSFETDEILQSWNINVPPSMKASTYEEGCKFAEKYGFPVVLKLVSSELLHKSDIGGVIVNIKSYDELGDAYKKIYERVDALDSKVKESVTIQIQKQVDKGVEVIVGVKKDPNFGHIMMFGAGGTLAEIIKDVNLKLAPLDHQEAQDLVKRSKVNTLLRGYRGDKPYDLDKLYALLVNVSELIINFPEFKEFEINPVIVTQDNAWAVDGKALL